MYTPRVVVVQAIEDLLVNDQVKAIVTAWYPGQVGGLFVATWVNTCMRVHLWPS